MSTLGANALTGDRPILVDIRTVVVSDTPRFGGADPAHIRVLAEIEATALPPITVHATTMRVIDGVHRLRAAELRGDEQISALLYHGSEANAFVLAVEANVTHGLPLSLSEREAATTRIIRSKRRWPATRT